MAQISFLLCIILLNALLGQTMSHSYIESNSNPPVISPSSTENLYRSQAPMNRKLGRHQPKTVESLVAPSLGPSLAPQGSENGTAKGGSSGEENGGSVEGNEIRLERNHRHSLDKSVAGGGVILGGLATAFLVAVFCYIRATGRHKDIDNN